ncbi:hypothetical protein SEA_TARGET_87 [Mycobacterium phage Target]|nr:hypothetical protein SEA_TARGET_87 [Mycobacterium phage Target]
MGTTRRFLRGSDRRGKLRPKFFWIPT